MIDSQLYNVFNITDFNININLNFNNKSSCVETVCTLDT